jgi:putative DNA-invertase from lambdoid prophage Rac
VQPSSTQPYPVVVYARVSTYDQNCALQLSELREYAARSGWKIADEYIDEGISGAKADRPALVQLMKDASMKRFQAVLVSKMDRFGRSVQQLITNVRELDELGIRFLAPSQSIDTDHKSPTGRLMMHILAAMAEFERELIRERTGAGAASYRAAYARGEVGKTRHSRSRKDLAIGRPRNIFRRDVAAKMRADGLSWRAIAKTMKVPMTTIRRSFAA